MAQSLFVRADEVIRLLGVSKSEAYRIIKRLNDEMASKGYTTRGLFFTCPLLGEQSSFFHGRRHLFGSVRR